MHVPFSMSDEPDLGDEFRQHDDYYKSSPPEPPPMRRGDGKVERLKVDSVCKYKFYSQSEVDAIIQQSLVAQFQLRQELLDVQNELDHLKQTMRGLIN